MQCFIPTYFDKQSFHSLGPESDKHFLIINDSFSRSACILNLIGNLIYHFSYAMLYPHFLSLSLFAKKAAFSFVMGNRFRFFPEKMDKAQGSILETHRRDCGRNKKEKERTASRNVAW